MYNREEFTAIFYYKKKKKHLLVNTGTSLNTFY